MRAGNILIVSLLENQTNKACKHYIQFGVVYQHSSSRLCIEEAKGMSSKLRQTKIMNIKWLIYWPFAPLFWHSYGFQLSCLYNWINIVIVLKHLLIIYTPGVFSSPKFTWSKCFLFKLLVSLLKMQLLKGVKQKSPIRDTLNLLPDADSSTNKKKCKIKYSLFFKLFGYRHTTHGHRDIETELA